MTAVHPRPLTTISTVVVFLGAVLAAGADWPHWRGPNHDGISAETGLQTAWTEKPPVVWEREIGSAFSAISCVGDRVYTCGTQNGQQVLLCLNADTGAVIWQTAFEPEYKERQGGDGTRGTPTVEDGRVYVQSAGGRILCCDAASGKEVWSRAFDAKPQWGYSGSILIEGDLAIAIGGDAEGVLVAMNKKTGEVVWRRGQTPVGYSTPYPFTLGGQRYVVGFLGKSVIIVEARSGREAWSAPWETDWDVNAATPIFHDGLLFISSGYKTGAAVFRLRAAGEKVAADEVWRGKAIMAKFQTPVLHEGHLYVSDQKALRCVELATGKEKWSQRGVENGTVVLAEGSLFVLTEDGRLRIGRASPEKFAPTTDVEILSGRCWTVPTLYRGRLYARNLERIVCLKLTR